MRERPRVLGIDVGGANLKYCDDQGITRSRYFPMWLDWQQLATVLASDIEAFAGVQAVAVTMTGELADCFFHREEGVRHIVEATCHAAAQCSIACCEFYGTDGHFHNRQSSLRQVDRLASANWHATATWAANQWVSGSARSTGILIDVGSTTSDLIPIRGGVLGTNALTDYERLVDGSLVYVGCQRTPVCSILDSLVHQGVTVPVMNEVFSTIEDALVLVGFGVEDVKNCQTADGKPQTRKYAANRLARMIGLDSRHVSVQQAQGLAKQVVEAAREKIDQAFRVIDPGGLIVLGGHGTEWTLIPAERPVIRLAQELGDQVSRCLPAYAAAQLWRRNPTCDV